MPQDSVRAPYLPYDALRIKAEEFLDTYHASREIPVPIEEIIEFAFNIDIVPTLGLQRLMDIDGFVSPDMRTIYVDSYVQNNRSRRYRFTLAHEIGHVVLHSEVMNIIRPLRKEEWEECLDRIDDYNYGWVENQAYGFAGLVLVPPVRLREEFTSAVNLAAGRGVSIAANEVAKSYVHDWLADRFNVSRQAIEKRTEKDGLWSV